MGVAEKPTLDAITAADERPVSLGGHTGRHLQFLDIPPAEPTKPAVADLRGDATIRHDREAHPHPRRDLPKWWATGRWPVGLQRLVADRVAVLADQLLAG